MTIQSSVESCQLLDFLNEKADLYNRPEFIEKDPIRIPHLFEQKNDIEIAGFLTALIAWGRRDMILANAMKLMHYMDMSPFGFVMQAGDQELKVLNRFVHRTFNGADSQSVVLALRHIYRQEGGAEEIVSRTFEATGSLKAGLMALRQAIIQTNPPARTLRHIANPEAGSAAKRLNMFLRWMVRRDNRGVDFGLWTRIPAAALMLPLDVHTGTVSRKLGLLTRRQNDWRAVEEVTARLQEFAPHDPVKYDFALFGLGIMEKF